MSVSARRSQIIVVGQKIRQIRKSRRLTQADLAGRIGVTQSDLSRMENGEYKVGLDTLFRILQVFELSMSRFFEEAAPEGEAEETAVPDGVPETQQLVADFEELDEESRRDVRDFIAFKKIQQQNRQPRWRPEEPAAEPEAPRPGPLLPFGRPPGAGRAE